MAYLAMARAGRTAEARLLALLAALRMRKDGTATLISEGLSQDRAGLPDSALGELVADGWIDTSLAAVRAAVSGAPAAVCPVPGMSGATLPAAHPCRAPTAGNEQVATGSLFLAGGQG
ncbi:hypothetical protein AB0G83_31395 [Streptomyces klenkii]|uniref:hypothetical protein n=1 Tax=Streptomyces klenkii TaxID=1420899 RepID=UPI0033F96AC6